MSSTRAPTLAETIDNAIRTALVDVRVCLPARIVRWDATKQQADCAILIKQAYLDEEGARQVESLPVVPSVPVIFPGGGGFRITWPIKADPSTGDTCLLIFSPTSLDKWLTGSGAEVDPEIDDSHGGLHNAVALPILKPYGAPWQNVPTDHATMGLDGADDGSHVKIHFRGTTIAIGDEAGNDFVALAQKVLTQFNNLQTHFAALEGIITGAVINEPGNGAPSALQAALKGAISGSPYPSPGSVAASQVKAK